MFLKMKLNNKMSAGDIVRHFDLTVTEQTVRNRLREKGIRSFKQKKKPFISQENKQSRVEWCKAHESWTVNDWERVLWSDESPFGLRFTAAETIYCRPEDRYLERNLRGTVKHQLKLNVWGAFTAHGVGRLHHVKGSGKNGAMCKEDYLKILQEQAVPSGIELLGEGFIFQQDNDPKHTAHVVKDRFAQLEEDGVLTLLPWPSQSPDLNPIEHVWGRLDVITKERKCNTLEELMVELQRGWEALPQELLKKLVHSMPRRIQAVLKAKGGPTKY